MEFASFLSVLLAVVIVLIIATIVVALIHSGLFTPIRISTGSPPVGELEVAYKFQQAPYKDCGHLFDEVASVIYGMNAKCYSFGLYYDSPDKVDEYKCRCIVGAVINDGSETSDEILKEKEQCRKRFDEMGFKIGRFPAVTVSVNTSFPFTTSLSIYIAVYRVYAQITHYCKSHALGDGPVLEMYRDDKILFMVPMERQEEFFVPEALTAAVDCDDECPDLIEAEDVAHLSADSDEGLDPEDSEDNIDDGNVTQTGQQASSDEDERVVPRKTPAAADGDGVDTDASTASSFEPISAGEADEMTA